MPGKRSLRMLWVTGMHSHVYLSEANILPISPAGRQGLLADPTLRTATAIALRTWSLWEPDAAVPGISTPHWGCSLILSYLLGFASSHLPSGPTSNPHECDWHPSLCNTKFAVPFSFNSQCWFQDLAFGLLCVCIASSATKEKAQQ